ncbi:MAG: DUF2975 domain-containing protein [Lachnospiraceae bacterium]|nr:DUF2975 domain-containing protein [Lachnospiraceae bacterium]
MENAKMKKTAVVIDRILKILQRVAIICGIIYFIFIVLALFLGEKIAANMTDMNVVSAVSLGQLRLTLKDDSSLLNESALKTSLAISLPFVAISIAICVYAIGIIRKVLEPMKEGRPFDKGISQMMKKLAWVTLVGGAIIQVGGSITKIAEVKAYDLAAFFSENAITGYQLNYVIDLNFIITACVLFLLSYVFRYGEELQRESDETL